MHSRAKCLIALGGTTIVPSCTSRSAHAVEEVHVSVVLVEHVVDHVLTAPAHDVVILPTLSQMHFGAEELRVLAAATAWILEHEGWWFVWTRMYRVEEVHLSAVADLDPDPTIVTTVDPRGNAL